MVVTSVCMSTTTNTRGDIMKLKDKKVDILAVNNIPNGNGYYTETLSPVALSVWAYFWHLSGKEIFAASAPHSVEEVLFIVGWRDGITAAHVIRFNGALYNITRVDTFEGYKGDITLYCRSKG